MTLIPMLMFTETEHPGNRGQKVVAKGKTNTYAGLEVQSNAEVELLPVKTIPAHFSQVYEASDRDFRIIFGWEDDPHRRNFAIGQPIDMEVPVCLDLDRFVERSNGIFGKSGTGKSFLTRLLLAGTIQRGRQSI